MLLVTTFHTGSGGRYTRFWLHCVGWCHAVAVTLCHTIFPNRTINICTVLQNCSLVRMYQYLLFVTFVLSIMSTKWKFCINLLAKFAVFDWNTWQSVWSLINISRSQNKFIYSSWWFYFMNLNFYEFAFFRLCFDRLVCQSSISWRQWQLCVSCSNDITKDHDIL